MRLFTIQFIYYRQPPKTSESRLATETKAEFTLKVNEHFVEGA